MKRLSAYFLSLLLSSLIVSGSAHLTIGKMICLGSGYTEYSLGKAQDCCGEKSPCATELSAGCCDLKNVSLSLPTFNISEKPKTFPQQVPNYFTLPVVFYKLQVASCQLAFPPDIFSSEPNELLHFISCLRI